MPHEVSSITRNKCLISLENVSINQSANFDVTIHVIRIKNLTAMNWIKCRTVKNNDLCIWHVSKWQCTIMRRNGRLDKNELEWNNKRTKQPRSSYDAFEAFALMNCEAENWIVVFQNGRAAAVLRFLFDRSIVYSDDEVFSFDCLLPHLSYLIFIIINNQESVWEKW